MLNSNFFAFHAGYISASVEGIYMNNLHPNNYISVGASSAVGNHLE